MIKNILDKYFKSGQITLEDVSDLLIEYYKLNNEGIEPDIQLIQGALQLVHTPLFNLNNLINEVATKSNITICKLHDQNGKLKSQWIEK